MTASPSTLRASDSTGATPQRLAGALGSYWQRRGGMPAGPPLAAAPTPREVEIAIIGGGLAGLATAIAVKDMRPGADVAVLEAETIGFGASGRNGGLLSPLAAPIWLLTAASRAEHGWALGHLNRSAADLARSLAARMPSAEASAETLRLEARGLLTGEGLARIARTLAAIGIDHDAGPRLGNGGRVLDIPANTVDPFALVMGLAAEARARGIAIHEGVRVARIEDGGTGARIMLAAPGAARGTMSGLVSARRVVIATNAYTGDIALPHQPKAHAIWNYMLATEPLDPARLEAIGGPGVFTVEINRAYVFHRRHAGRIVFGGIDRLRHKPGEFDVPPGVGRGLDRLLRASFGAEPLPTAVAWAGRYHATRTELPIIGPAPGLATAVLNVGYGGTGVVLTQVLAPVAAALALGLPCPDRDAERLHAAMEATRPPIGASVRFGAGVAWAAAGAMARRA